MLNGQPVLFTLLSSAVAATAAVAAAAVAVAVAVAFADSVAVTAAVTFLLEKRPFWVPGWPWLDFH